jgi:hypothetical protein
MEGKILNQIAVSALVIVSQSESASEAANELETPAFQPPYPSPWVPAPMK